jgi:hypothetical protein
LAGRPDLDTHPETIHGGSLMKKEETFPILSAVLMFQNISVLGEAAFDGTVELVHLTSSFEFDLDPPVITDDGTVYMILSNSLAYNAGDQTGIALGNDFLG